MSRPARDPAAVLALAAMSRSISWKQALEELEDFDRCLDVEFRLLAKRRCGAWPPKGTDEGKDTDKGKDKEKGKDKGKGKDTVLDTEVVEVD